MTTAADLKRPAEGLAERNVPSKRIRAADQEQENLESLSSQEVHDDSQIDNWVRFTTEISWTLRLIT